MSTKATTSQAPDAPTTAAEADTFDYPVRITSGAGESKDKGKDGEYARPRRLRKFLAGYARFSLVGVGNWLIDYGTLNLLLWLWATDQATRLVLYNLVALVLANANSYLWNTLWTFRGRTHHTLRQTTMFIAQALLNVGVASGLLWLAAGSLFAHTTLSPVIVDNLAKALSSTAATTLSFLVLHYLVFPENSERVSR